MHPTVWAAMMAGGLFVGMVACVELGYRLGGRHSKDVAAPHEGIGAMEAAVYGLLGLLLALSFSGGSARLDARRKLIVEEANAIGTAYLRLDLLPAGEQPALRRSFREYLDARLSVYEKMPDLDAAEREIARAATIQNTIWSQAIAAARNDPTGGAPRLLLPAINEMIDVTTSRTVALHVHLPGLIFALLIGVALLSGLLAGYAMAKRKRRSWLHMFVYVTVVSLTIYAVADLDDPRSGLIRLDAADHALSQLRESIR